MFVSIISAIVWKIQNMIFYYEMSNTVTVSWVSLRTKFFSEVINESSQLAIDTLMVTFILVLKDDENFLKVSIEKILSIRHF